MGGDSAIGKAVEERDLGAVEPDNTLDLQAQRLSDIADALEKGDIGGQEALSAMALIGGDDAVRAATANIALDPSAVEGTFSDHDSFVDFVQDILANVMQGDDTAVQSAIADATTEYGFTEAQVFQLSGALSGLEQMVLSSLARHGGFNTAQSAVLQGAEAQNAKNRDNAARLNINAALMAQAHQAAMEATAAAVNSIIDQYHDAIENALAEFGINGDMAAFVDQMEDEVREAYEAAVAEYMRNNIFATEEQAKLHALRVVREQFPERFQQGPNGMTATDSQTAIDKIISKMDIERELTASIGLEAGASSMFLATNAFNAAFTGETLTNDDFISDFDAFSAIESLRDSTERLQGLADQVNDLETEIAINEQRLGLEIMGLNEQIQSGMPHDDELNAYSRVGELQRQLDADRAELAKLEPVTAGIEQQIQINTVQIELMEMQEGYVSGIMANMQTQMTDGAASLEFGDLAAIILNAPPEMIIKSMELAELTGTDPNQFFNDLTDQLGPNITEAQRTALENMINDAQRRGELIIQTQANIDEWSARANMFGGGPNNLEPYDLYLETLKYGIEAQALGLEEGSPEYQQFIGQRQLGQWPDEYARDPSLNAAIDALLEEQYTQGVVTDPAGRPVYKGEPNENGQVFYTVRVDEFGQPVLDEEGNVDRLYYGDPLMIAEFNARGWEGEIYANNTPYSLDNQNTIADSINRVTTAEEEREITEGGGTVAVEETEQISSLDLSPDERSAEIGRVATSILSDGGMQYTTDEIQAAALAAGLSPSDVEYIIADMASKEPGLEVFESEPGAGTDGEPAANQFDPIIEVTDPTPTHSTPGPGPNTPNHNGTDPNYQNPNNNTAFQPS